MSSIRIKIEFHLIWENKMQELLNGTGCLRLYDQNKEHRLSIMICSENCFDLATPDGKVLYCGVDLDLVEVLAANMVVGTFE